jgi:hypothetical protein
MGGDNSDIPPGGGHLVGAPTRHRAIAANTRDMQRELACLFLDPREQDFHQVSLGALSPVSHG